MIWEIDDGKQKEVEGLDAAGRPDPAYAAALGLLSAPLGRRALAMTIDMAVLLALQLPFWLGAVALLLKFGTGTISVYGLVNHPGFVLAIVTTAVTLVLTLVYSIVQWILHGRRGVTLGKNITGIRTVNVRTLERPKVGAVLLRFLIVGASGIVPLIGPVLFLSSPAFDPARRRRGWHDLATGTWLVDVKQGLNPFDEKRMRVARKMVVAEPVAERAELPSLATPVGPGAQPSYRPGNRVSAGVLGVARPHDGRRRAESDRPEPMMPARGLPSEAGKPVLGGYRSLATDANAPAPAPAPPAMPSAPQHAPQATPPAPASEPLSVAVPPKAPEQTPEPPSVAVHVEEPRTPASAPPASAPSASAPSAAAPASAAASAALVLVLDSGERIPVSAPVLLGRNPDASAHAGARPVPMADDTRSLSKTHMLVRPVPGGLEITDCRSTNGSGLVRAGVEYSVAADVPVITIEGDRIRLGDRVATVMRG
ncbi:RDD family protein [Microbacterium sp. Mu-80]|uniref:RDD family protein n=1 Tax=Microbacterium bandirmense TaxID=3122050 RepID=A0ABU8LFR5_9MICO